MKASNLSFLLTAICVDKYQQTSLVAYAWSHNFKEPNILDVIILIDYDLILIIHDRNFCFISLKVSFKNKKNLGTNRCIEVVLQHDSLIKAVCLILKHFSL